MTLAGYAGQFGGVLVDTRIPSIDIKGAFERMHEWDSTDTGTGHISYSLRFPRIWFRPRVSGFLLTRGNEYQLLTPGFDLTVFSSFAVIASELDYYRWDINGKIATESEGNVSLIFDRTKYSPILTFGSRYTDQEFKPTVAGQFNIRNLHLTLGSAVTEVPSPLFRVGYSQPTVRIAAQIRSGVKFCTLYEYYQYNIPLHYQIPVPDETLRVSVDLDAEFDLYDHLVSLSFSYKDWYYRLVAGNDYQISHANDMREINARLRVHDIFRFNLMNISNTCNIYYNWSDSAISFLPEYAISDTLDILFGVLEIGADLCYVSTRPGLEGSLPHYYIISTDVGLRIKFFKPYFLIHNITDTKTEIFDDYYFLGRQYAAGLNVNWRF